MFIFLVLQIYHICRKLHTLGILPINLWIFRNTRNCCPAKSDIFRKCRDAPYVLGHGELLYHKQKEAGWGKKFLERISLDLRNDFPEIKGFSVRNCQFMIQFYKEYNQEFTYTKPTVSQLESGNTKLTVSQLSAQKFKLPITQIGWAHNVVIMQRVKDIDARYWYMVQTIKNS